MIVTSAKERVSARSGRVAAVNHLVAIDAGAGVESAGTILIRAADGEGGTVGVLAVGAAVAVLTELRRLEREELRDVRTVGVVAAEAVLLDRYVREEERAALLDVAIEAELVDRLVL